MNILNEKRTFTTVRLTENQKKVMTRIVASATEVLAAEEISKGRGLVAARDLLVKLGLIEFRDGSATITSSGEKIMKDTNLTDDMGELTEEGNKFAYEEGNQPMATESLIKQIHQTLSLHEALNRRSPAEQKAAKTKELSIFSTAEKIAIIAIHEGKKELDMDSPLYEKLYKFFAESGDMPYGIQKARTGDPDEWILEHLGQLISNF